MQVAIQKHLANCREIPDLWHYRALVSERLHDTRDAAYSKREAQARGSEALRDQVNPFTGVPAAASTLPVEIGAKYALVVGIDDFQHAPALRFAVNDASSVADLLTDKQIGRFESAKVWRLLNRDATLGAFRKAIGEIRALAREEDLVVVYIASHGSPREMDPNGVSYVLMQDTTIDTAANLYATSLQMIDLVEILRRDVRARRVVLLLDTCFSGGATGVRGVVVHSPNAGPESEFSAAADRFEDRTAKGAARVVISASRAGEPSREDEKLHHGYFTYFLLEALKKNQGMSPLSEVFQSVHDRTADAVRPSGFSQTPTMRNTPEGLSIMMGVPGRQR
ncbi:MAG TPA: caspase family protein [Candidatus Acidoferrales bacterium]|nr:caspase family protein [Candidatus Acidoferrales bacterium]